MSCNYFIWYVCIYLCSSEEVHNESSGIFGMAYDAGGSIAPFMATKFWVAYNSSNSTLVDEIFGFGGT